MIRALLPWLATLAEFAGMLVIVGAICLIAIGFAPV